MNKETLVKACYAFLAVFALEFTKTFRKIAAAIMFVVVALMINAAFLVVLTVLVLTRGN